MEVDELEGGAEAEGLPHAVNSGTPKERANIFLEYHE
jgi:hypothetical protein